MKYPILLSALFGCCLQTHAAADDTLQLTGGVWKLQQQVYTSRDASGTDVHRIKGKAGDIIRFEKNGKAIVHYKGNCDTLDYTLSEGHFLHIGNETPYRISVTGPGTITLIQKTEETTDGYNSIFMELKR